MERFFRGRTSRKLASLELRSVGSGLPKITGYAAVFYRSGDDGTQYDLGSGHMERIAPGAFDRAIREDDVRALFNHDWNCILGRKSAGTLRLAVDGFGLKYEIDTPDSDIGRRVVEAIQRGDVDGSSFSFNPRRADHERDGGRLVSTLVDVALFDVGPVALPAYSGTEASVKRSTQRTRPTLDAATAQMELDYLTLQEAR
jgi:HK97 family phage prohead protease